MSYSKTSVAICCSWETHLRTCIFPLRSIFEIFLTVCFSLELQNFPDFESELFFSGSNLVLLECYFYSVMWLLHLSKKLVAISFLICLLSASSFSFPSFFKSYVCLLQYNLNFCLRICSVHFSLYLAFSCGEILGISWHMLHIFIRLYMPCRVLMSQHLEVSQVLLLQVELPHHLEHHLLFTSPRVAVLVAQL